MAHDHRARPASSGPPVRDADGGWSVTRHADVTAVLTDPDCVVPAAPDGPPGTLAWLRGTVSRFSAPNATRPAGRSASPRWPRSTRPNCAPLPPGSP
ncbi:cytochrome P450 [Micromonospora sp. R77]|uniref:cytochrome P450 n=1 Tax=Micromonospora sp. R77 TaxID=2925836 RepID=UPI001F606E94|nr:cytochrome P450 [Micromonospora sp. R77]MCI4065885.1 cytochrome P450 [Micromonospora sp. R77]